VVYDTSFAERYSDVDKTVLYSGSIGFKYRPRHRLSYLGFSPV